MKTKKFLAVGMIIILVLIGLAGCSTAGVAAADVQPVNVNVGNQQTGIWVNGEGKVTVTPDIAIITLGVSARADKVADAQAQAATAMDKVITALTSNDVDKKDIQTQYYSIQQYYTPIPAVTDSSSGSSSGAGIYPLPVVPPTPVQQAGGYEVDNTVTAKIRAVDKVGTIIDAVTAAGGDNMRVNGINFSVEHPEQYYGQARELAMKDAQAKAEDLARLSGVNLGKVTYISENTSYQPIYAPAYMSKGGEMAVPAPTTSISPGQTDITLDVQVAYAIQ